MLMSVFSKGSEQAFRERIIYLFMVLWLLIYRGASPIVPLDLFWIGFDQLVRAMRRRSKLWSMRTWASIEKMGWPQPWPNFLYFLILSRLGPFPILFRYPRMIEAFSIYPYCYVLFDVRDSWSKFTHKKLHNKNL